MKRFLKIFLTVAACCTVCSCNKDTTNSVSGILAAADSIMSDSPEKALEYLSSLDSTVTAGINRKELAMYTLLMTEARYQCWLPVASDTAIHKAVAYFREKGPESMYSRALIMQGAVNMERGQFISALKSYKTAEPVIAASGDLLELGLLHTRIGELFQMSFVNKQSAISRYKQALDCFRQTGLTDHIMFGDLTLARVMLFDSTDAALPYIKEGSALAEKLGDNSMRLISYELMTHYYDLKHKPDSVIHTATTALSGYGPDDSQMQSVIESMRICLLKAYTDKGMTEEASDIASLICTDNCDRQTYHYIQSLLAASRQDWKSALEHERIAEGIADSLMEAGFGMHLKGVENNYENTLLEQSYISLRSRYFSYLMVFSCVICIIIIAGLIIYFKNITLRHEVEKSTDIIRSLSEGRLDINDETDKQNRDNKNASNKESIAISEEMLKVTDELMEAYYKYGRTKAIAGYVKNILEKHFPKDDTMTRVRKIVDATYPGFLSSLEKEHPTLKGKDIYTISLMVCGFSTGTICALRRISESSLYVEKSRIAKKIGTGMRLSEFITEALNARK